MSAVDQGQAPKIIAARSTPFLDLGFADLQLLRERVRQTYMKGIAPLMKNDARFDWRREADGIIEALLPETRARLLEKQIEKKIHAQRMFREQLPERLR